MHGIGKHLAKGEASRVLRHLVTEHFLVEDVKKSDTYGSVSSVLKVKDNNCLTLSNDVLKLLVLLFCFLCKRTKEGLKLL